MAWIDCSCGARLSDVAWPSPHTHHLISDEALDGITDYGLGIIKSDDFDERAAEVLECYACKRLLILRRGETAITYHRESP